MDKDRAVDGPDRPALVGLDWGTTSLRAYLVAADGRILETRAAEAGILQVEDRAYGTALAAVAGAWLAERPGLPVIASGMITSRNGWLETPYLPLPAGPAELAAALVPFVTEAGIRIRFVTGLLATDGSTPDVMRGEETELVGQLAQGAADGTFVLPGTHVKWAAVEGGRIVRFRTFMTGEVYGALRDHTILGRLMEPSGGPSDPAFRRGVEEQLSGDSAPGDLLHDLFAVRTLPLTGRMAATDVADYLSGMLVGAEVAAAVRHLPPDEAVTIVGRGDLAERYALALRLAGRNPVVAPPGAAAHGHHAMAMAAGLLEEIR